MRSPGLVALAVVLVVALALSLTGPAHAHQGAQVSLAQFTAPPPLLTARGDLGLSPSLLAVADASYTVAWNDGDSDPTGRYYFYYLDHLPPSSFKTDDVKALATAIPEGAAGFWSSCVCVDGNGVQCPDAGDRDCPNQFSWDTHALPDGTYWLFAIDNDPPYYLYSLSQSPLRIAHGATPPPAVLFLQPNGIGLADQTYTLRWIADGQAPLHFDLAWGSNVYPASLQPPTPIGGDVPATLGADGTWSLEWSTANLPAGDTYVELHLRDGAGHTVFTDSLNLTIFHAPVARDAAATPADLGPATRPTSGGCDITPVPTLPAFAALALAALLLALLRALRPDKLPPRID